MRKKITLPLTIVNQILAHAQSQEDNEICGLISEKESKITSIYPIQNVSENTENFYKMDGKAQIDAMRNMRDNNEHLYGIYHSHPHSEAYPSKTDVQQSQYPDAIYFIVSLNTKGVLDLRAYQLRKGDVDILEVDV